MRTVTRCSGRLSPHRTGGSTMTAPKPSYRTIPLSKGQVALVDATDYVWLSQWKWAAIWADRTRSFYAWRWSPMVNTKRHKVYMHRQILGLEHGDKRQGDHKESGRTLDNRRSNLRIASPSQNSANRRLERGTASGIKGVCRDQSRTKWRARIYVNRRRLNLGAFASKEKAGKAYRAAAEQYFGEFARTA